MQKQLYQQHGKTLPKQNTTKDEQTFMVKIKYNSRWTNAYGKENINLLRPNTVNIIEFITEKLKRGLSYNSLVSVIHLIGSLSLI